MSCLSAASPAPGPRYPHSERVSTTRLREDVYEALRPGRSTAAVLAEIAARLDAADAPLCAALTREAAEVYARRGLLTNR